MRLRQLQTSSSTGMTTRRGYRRGKHLDIKALRRQEVTGQGAPSRPRRQRHQDTECGPNHSSHKVLQDTGISHAGNERSTKSAGEPWSRAQDDTKNWIGDIQV